jgi:methylsterol monooxygenase
MSFVMHEVVYFGRAVPWVIIDQIPYFNQYKIQNVSPVISLAIVAL